MASKVILVTGCSKGGAGHALAEEFRYRGHHVFATSTDGTRMVDLESIGVVTLAMDVTSQKSVDAAVDTVRETAGGQLHILVNNAAVFSLMPLADVDIEEGKNIFDVNFFGVLRVINTFLPLLMAVEEHAVVANVSSISAIMHPTWQGMYASSKAALLSMGNIMRVELAPLRIKVVTIVSGGVDSAGMRNSSNQAQLVPEKSFYKTLAPSIETNAQGRSMVAMSTAEYARQVANDILQENPKPLIWRGSYAWIAWVCSWFGWTGMMDETQRVNAGLDKIQKGGADAGRLLQTPDTLHQLLPKT